MGKRAPSKGGRVEQTGYYELQNLESRLLLSGSVTAVIDGSGNLTITGSVANIIVVESAKPEVKIGFWDYFRVGLPITVMTLIVGWAWLEWVK